MGSCKSGLASKISPKNAFIIIYALGFLITASFQFYALDVKPFMEVRAPCVEFFQKGELYTGQPACIEGPVGYGILAFIDLLFPSHQQIATLIFNYILFIIIFFFLLEMLKKEEVVYSRFLLLASYLVLFVILARDDSLALYTTFFLFMGVYYLIYGKKYARVLSAILFSLAIHTKMIAIPFLTVFIVLYAFYKLNKKVDILKFVGVFISMLLIISAILEILFPGLFLYTTYWHFKSDTTYEHSFKNVAPPFKFLAVDILADNSAVYPIRPYLFNNTYFIQAISVFVLIYLIFSAFLFIKKRHIISSFSLLSVIFFIIVLSYKYFMFRFRYFIPILPFFIFMLNNTYYEFSSKFGKKLFFVLFVVLTYSAVMTENRVFMTNTQKFKLFEKEAAIALQFIPEEFSLLMDSPDVFTEAGIELNMSRAWLYPENHPYAIDDWDARFFEQLGILNPKFNDWREFPYRNKTIVEKNIKSGVYDAIILSNLNPGSITMILMNVTNPYKYSLLFPKINEKCINCQFQGVVLFKNETEYNAMTLRMGIAYRHLFMSLCKKDRIVADHILDTLLEDGILISIDRCDNNDDYFRRATGEGIINSGDNIYTFMFIFLYSLLLFWVIMPNERKIFSKDV